MISVVQNNEIYQITFRYDPILVNLVKNVPGRCWLPESKMWTIPKDRLGMFLNQVKGTKYESQVNIVSDEHLDENATLDSTSNIPDIDISNVTLYVEKGYSLFQHQIDFMKYSIDRLNRGLTSGFILCDEQGLGKSLECINMAMYGKTFRKFKHCLIICCINTSKYNWYDEIIRHTNGQETPYILGTRINRKGKTVYGGGQDKFNDLRTGCKYGIENGEPLPYFIITNIESLRTEMQRKYVVAQELLRMMKCGDLNMICIDEIHKNASPSSKQGRLILRLKKSKPDNILWIPMTGTPLVNKPTDVFTPLRLVDGHAFGSYYMWCKQFCVYGGFGGHEIIGYKNIPELKRILQNNMLRRLKSEVLDLPDKIQYVEFVENSPYQNKLYATVLSEIKEQRAAIVSSLNPLAKLMRLRQVNGSPELVDLDLMKDKKYTDAYLKYNSKLKRLLELLEEIHDRNEKVIIYSNWVEPLRIIYRFVAKKYKVVTHTGTMTEQARNNSKYAFQHDPTVMIIMGTIQSLGTTHTLTAATNIIFYDEPWTPSDRVQAEDRANRIGSTEPLSIYALISKDTVDERVHNILYTKDSLSKYIVDDSIDIHSHPELLDLIIGI